MGRPRPGKELKRTLIVLRAILRVYDASRSVGHVLEIMD